MLDSIHVGRDHHEDLTALVDEASYRPQIGRIPDREEERAVDVPSLVVLNLSHSGPPLLTGSKDAFDQLSHTDDPATSTTSAVPLPVAVLVGELRRSADRWRGRLGAGSLHSECVGRQVTGDAGGVQQEGAVNQRRERAACSTRSVAGASTATIWATAVDVGAMPTFSRRTSHVGGRAPVGLHQRDGFARVLRVEALDSPGRARCTRPTYIPVQQGRLSAALP